MQFRGVSWDLPGWNPHSQTGDEHIWTNDRGDAMVAIYAANPPDIPKIGGPANEDETRDYYRRTMASMNGGIVEVGYDNLRSYRVVRTLLKQRLEPSGFGYIGAWLIPFRNAFYVFRFESVERGATGAREAVVMASEMPDPVIDERGKISGWMIDPYDRSRDEGALYTLADQEKYDAILSDHPLSHVRRYLRDFQATVRFSWLLKLKAQHVV